jgi:hypothetical protein
MEKVESRWYIKGAVLQETWLKQETALIVREALQK